MRLDLNCDLGEGEPPARTRALLRLATSANVACGGHAGDADTMERCVRWAGESGVHLGAHPGIPGAFGRGEIRIGPDDLGLLLLAQVGALHRLATLQRVRLHHVKLHGSLYHAVEHDAALGRAYVGAMARWFPGTVIYALAGGRVAALGRRHGVTVWEEAFLDRAYRADGTLVPRGEAGALLTTPAELRARLDSLRREGGWPAQDGTPLRLAPRTLCVHGDSPGALLFLRAARAELTRTDRGGR